ncbi:hypothetical protein B566_EDAN007116 [Ephemera danica]|nr:hypothetical protein B566_EDAN007116 [Ephemera danica]
MLVRVTVRPSTPVGCRRRPALLCIPSNNNNNANKKRANKEVYLPRAPSFPPSPAPHEKPLRVLPGGWAEFYCSDAGGTGRVYYFHAVTGDRSWKPPRTRKPGETQGDEISAPEDGNIKRSRSPSPSTRLVLPPGWEESYDEDADLPCYIHKTTGAKDF